MGFHYSYYTECRYHVTYYTPDGENTDNAEYDGDYSDCTLSITLFDDDDIAREFTNDDLELDTDLGREISYEFDGRSPKASEDEIRKFSLAWLKENATEMM